MASGRVHIRTTDGAIDGAQTPDLQDGAPNLLRAHSISVADVELLGEIGDREPAILLTAVVEDNTGSTATIRLALQLDTAEMAAIMLAHGIDAARGRTAP